MFPTSLARVGPKHSTSVPSSATSVIPQLNVDVNEVAVVVLNLASQTPPGPQSSVSFGLLWVRPHSVPLLPPTLQMVIPLLSPATVHRKVKGSWGQEGGGAVNCPPATSPGDKKPTHPLMQNLYHLMVCYVRLDVISSSTHHIYICSRDLCMVGFIICMP